MENSALEFIKAAAENSDKGEKKGPGYASRMGQGALLVGIPSAIAGGTKVNLGRDGLKPKRKPGLTKWVTRGKFGKDKPVVTFSKTKALTRGIGGAGVGAAGGALYHASEKAKTPAGKRIARGAAAGTVVPGVGTTIGALGGGAHHVAQTAKEYADSQRKAS